MQAPLFEMSPVERLRHALRQAFDAGRRSATDWELEVLRDLGSRLGSAKRYEDSSKPDKVFSDNWFTRRYFFLFKKNLSVTNIQFAELFSLLRTHATYVGDDDRVTHSWPQLQLLSRSDFRDLLDHVLHDVELSGDTEKAIEHAAATFQMVFERTILVAQFFGSCAIFVPPYLDFDLGLICGESGYIHSCGHLVYVRNVEKAKKESFLENLNAHLDEHYASGKRATLIPYSHEAFTKSDEHEREMLRGGLDDVKIHTTKYFIGAYSLVDVLNELQERIDDRVWIPDPGPYSTEHNLEMRSQAGADFSRTIWILCDREISIVPLTVRAPRRFVIVYDQLFANKNRYHEFDENKPAWLDHTTLPHTLTGAMINITRPWGSPDMIVVDPFAGTGTTLFEATKVPGVTSIGIDDSPIAKRVIADNQTFFSAPVDWLRRYREELHRIESDPHQFDQEHDRRTRRSELQQRYDWAEALLHRCVRADTDPVFAAEDVRALNETDIRRRLMFYLLLKAERRNARAFKSGDARWFAAVGEEARRLGERVDALLRIDEARDAPTGSGGVNGAQHLRLLQTRYSLGVATKAPALEHADDAGSVGGIAESLRAAIRKADARDFSEAWDVIVTDPPYGFNTEEGAILLGEVYRESLTRFFTSLRSGRDGHLVVCLPEQSFIGRGTPWFTRRGAYIRLVFALAENFDREVVRIGQVFPSRSRTAGPPYYWQSDRALRRTILHFVLRPRATRAVPPTIFSALAAQDRLSDGI